jgi:hypothetical protein
MTFFHMSIKLTIAILICASIVQSQVDSALSYYPLEKGNSWQYKSTYVERLMGGVIGSTVHYYTVNINGDTTITNGNRYLIVLSSNGSQAHPRYQRVDSLTAQVFGFDTSNGGKEYQIDSLRAPASSSFAGCRLSSLRRTYVSTVDSQGYFGVRLISRHYFTLFGAGEGTPQILYTLTQNLGLTTVIQASTGFDQYEGSSTDDTLVYAKINGKEYGTLVSVHQNKEAVTHYIVHQNYPNPFNSTTIISYSLFEACHVSLIVHDVLGRGVATLVDEWQNRGAHSATFYGDNISSGLYFYNLKAGPFSATRKLILLK